MASVAASNLQQLLVERSTSGLFPVVNEVECCQDVLASKRRHKLSILVELVNGLCRRVVPRRMEDRLSEPEEAVQSLLSRDCS